MESGFFYHRGREGFITEEGRGLSQRKGGVYHRGREVLSQRKGVVFLSQRKKEGVSQRKGEEGRVREGKGENG
jgi:hypothetical protein